MYFLLKKKIKWIQDIIFAKECKNKFFCIPLLIGFYLKKALT